MKDFEGAKTLAETMVEIGKRSGRATSAVITNMDQPLGNTIGNGIEVFEAIQVLKNEGPEDLKELSIYLAATGMVKAKKARNIESAKNILNKLIENGQAYDKFEEIVKEQGGSLEYVRVPEKLCETQFAFTVEAQEAGYVEETHALTCAKAAKMLGTGRSKKEDSVNHNAGVLINKKIGDKVYKDEVLAKVFANSIEEGQNAKEELQKAFKLSKEPVSLPQLVFDVIE